MQMYRRNEKKKFRFNLSTIFNTRGKKTLIKKSSANSFPKIYKVISYEPFLFYPEICQ